MAETLTPLDATFLELEQLDQGALMSIGGVMVFEPAAGGTLTVESVRANLAARLRGLPRYSQRLSNTTTTRFSRPRWEAATRFDISDHVRHSALPAPGTESQLFDWTAEFFSHPLDRARPLWEMVLVEGLEHSRWAIGWKTHHCLVDGVGSVDLVELLLDTERSPAARPPSVGPATDDQAPHTSLRHPPAAVVQTVEAAAHAVDAAVHALLHPRSALDRSRALAEVIVRDELHGSPHTSLNVPIGQARRFAAVRAPLSELKAIGHALGGSVNDVVLAACSSGLRRLLLARREPLPSQGLRAMVPMSLRDASGCLELGNRVTSLFVDLPVAEADPFNRMREIAASMRRLKASGAAKGASAMLDLAGLAPPAVLHATLARAAFSSRLFNVTITNIPGPRAPLYAFGSEMREVYPVVPLAAGHAVGIAIFSYNGLVTFGINANRESMHDVDVLATGIEDGIEELNS